MKTPARLQSLVEEGLIDAVLRQLMSGKEANVYVVRCGGETRAAKVYKEANNRSFRQAVDAAGNNHAQRMLLRDVGNLRDFFGSFAPALLTTTYGAEIWDLFARGMLQPETPLSGNFMAPVKAADVSGVLREIDDARAEEAARRLRLTGV